MATAITHYPELINAAYTRLPFAVGGSTNVSQPQFQYVFDIYESGSAELITRLTQVPDPDSVSIFDPSRIFQGELSYDNTWKLVVNSGSLQRQKTFTVKAGEQYGTSISSSITVYPNLDSKDISVFAAAVDPYAGRYYNQNIVESSAVGPVAHDAFPEIIPTSSFDITTVDPIIAQRWNGLNWASRHDGQLSTCPYNYVETLNNPYKDPSDSSWFVQNANHKPIGAEDYETADLLLAVRSGSVLYPATPTSIAVELKDVNNQTLFSGLSYYDTPIINAYYVGNIDGIIMSYGTGPANLRNVPMSNSLTGSLGNQTFGQVLDSGSWFRLSVGSSVTSAVGNKSEFNFYFNEDKADLFQSSTAGFVSTNKQVPYPNNIGCTEKTRFAFINKYGVWDYYTNWNPVRRTSDIQRESVTQSWVYGYGGSATFDKNRRGQIDYFIDRKDRFVVDTPPLDKPVANWLEQLFESPSVYIQKGDDFVPVIITNTSYVENNSTSRNKLFTYTIEFEPANQPYGTW